MAASKSNAPVASKWVFLSQLDEQELTTKVRFLGCLLEYDESTGRALLEHEFPKSSRKSKASRAIVDMKLVLETTDKSCFERGNWINVIGYVQSKETVKIETPHASSHLSAVQAVLVWNAGAVRLDKYEDILRQQLSLSL